MICEFAPAKVNLTLRVLGRRDDGYHDLESLVAFADVGDEVTFTPGEPLALEVDGPGASAAGPISDNLILKAAQALAERVAGLTLGRFFLTKHLPVAAGLGGGSSDAAAALRLLARVNGLAGDDPRLMDAARATGADVPVCLDPHPRVMRGTGDVLSEPLELPALSCVLVNPGVALPTKDVFAALGRGSSAHPCGDAPATRDHETWRPDSFDMMLAASLNDLEPAAISIRPVVADVIAALRDSDGCWLARMSGSGATCFGLYRGAPASVSAAAALSSRHPAWWVRPAVIASFGRVARGAAPIARGSTR